MRTQCPTCWAEVEDKGLVAYFNLDGTVHFDCFMKTHTMVPTEHGARFEVNP